MKSIKRVFEDAVSFENLYAAYHKARLHRRYQEEVLAFTANLEENLHELRAELLSGAYTPAPYREFYVYRPKKRLIMAPGSFRDRVVHWAIYQALQPQLVKGYITHSFACIKGRGTHRAVSQLQQWLRPLARTSTKHYYLKLDISKFYYRIDHDKLLGILQRKVSDKRMAALLEQVVRCESNATGLPAGMEPGDATLEDRLPDKGVPTGSLLSTMFANLYLNELDQFCKRRLGIKKYIRYMDDVVLLADNKQQLHEWQAAIEAFLQERLGLELNNKTALRPVTLGVEFCGYKLWPTHTKLRKSTALRMKRRLKHIQKKYARGEMGLHRAQKTVGAYMAILKHCNSYRLRLAIFGEYSEEVWAPGWFYLQRQDAPTAAAC